MYRDDNNSQPFMIERIVAALSYLTMGFVGFVWLIIGLFTKTRLTKFLQYHIFQSIFISIAYVLLSMFLGFVVNILSLIPFINKIVAQLTFFLNMPLLFGYSLIQAFIYALMIYLAITSFAGKYSYLPYISNIINYNVKR